MKEENFEKVEFLKSYKRLTRKLESLMEQKQEIIETMVSAKAQTYDDMPKAGRKTDLSDYIVRLEKILNEIDDKKAECLAKKILIESRIIEMENGNECDILRMKYINFKSWEEIAVKLCYDVRHIYRLHGNALAHIKMS